MAQQLAVPDSIASAWHDLPEDTTRVNVMLLTAEELGKSNYELSNKVAYQAKALAEKLRFHNGITESYRLIASNLSDLGEYQQALDFNYKALTYHRTSGDSLGAAGDYARIAVNLGYQGHYDSAMVFYFDALRLQELEADSAEMVKTLNNIGYTYWNIEEIDKAQQYYEQALKIVMAMDNQEHMAALYTNMGIMMASNDRNEEARNYFEDATEISRANSFNYLEAINLANLGELASNDSNYVEAVRYFEEALRINETIENLQGQYRTLKALGETYLRDGKYDKSIPYFMASLTMARSLQADHSVIDAYLSLSKAYKGKGRYVEALAYHERYLEKKDSVLDAEKAQQINTLEAQYQNEKQILINDTLSKALQVSDLRNLEQGAREDRNHWIIGALAGGFAIVLLAAILILRGLRKIQQANRTITAQKVEVERQRETAERQRYLAEEQRAMVEEKNSEILDSIQYARRLQEAILPPSAQMDAELAKRFVLYLPKDIVSGDFYWMAKQADTTFFAVVDCTGHGVPGAMVSVVGANGLNRCVKEFELSDPAAILDRLSIQVEETFSNTDSGVNDGMDITLCAWNRSQNTLQFAGANNPLYVWRPAGEKGLRVDGQQQVPILDHETGTLYQVKGDKQPIGKFEGRTNFTSKSVSIQPGDRLFLFSDGFADQFGGEKGKKLKLSNFRRLLGSVQYLPLHRQGEEINHAFQTWRGDLEQVDDVCVMGVGV